MPIGDDQPDTGKEHRLEACLSKLAAGDLGVRDELVAIVCDRMSQIAHRMLRRFPGVRRYDETDDVVQNAAMRLYRALAEVRPTSVQHFISLAGVQIRRELLDMARRNSGPESYAANHETNYARGSGEAWAKVDKIASQAEPAELLDNWSRLHEAAAAMPPEEKELFHLVWYLGAKQDEAARILNCSTRTIKRRWDSVKQLIDRELNGERPD